MENGSAGIDVAERKDGESRCHVSDRPSRAHTVDTNGTDIGDIFAMLMSRLYGMKQMRSCRNHDDETAEKNEDRCRAVAGAREPDSHGHPSLL